MTKNELLKELKAEDLYTSGKKTKRNCRTSKLF